jgi:hypothetical protein
MPSEKRNHVEIFIPLRSDAVEYRIITDWLAEEMAYVRGGSTLTTPFTGLYSSIAQPGIIRDDIQVIFCDFDLDVDNPDHGGELMKYLEDLRLLMMGALNEEEVWIVYHAIARITGE